MNDLRLPGLRSTGPNAPGHRLDGSPAPSRGPAAADLVSFERALQRSADRPGQAADASTPRATDPRPGPSPVRTSDEPLIAQRALDAMRERSRLTDRAQAARREQRRDGEGERPAPAAAAPDGATPTAKANDGAAASNAAPERGRLHSDTTAIPTAQSTDDHAGADAAQEAPAADGEAPGAAADASRAVPLAIGTYAEVTHSLVAAAAAGSVSAQQAKAMMSADALATAADDAEAGADEGGADPQAVAGTSDLALSSPGPTDRARIPGKAAAHADAAAGAGTAPAALAAEASGDLTRTPARDRLLEDFERRFESSLARAAGASGGSPLNPTGPLAAAGLPLQAAPSGSSMTIAYAGVAAPIGHPSFGNDLSHRVLMFAGQRVQSAEISVTPGELGPIRVTIDVRGQEAAMQFSAAHATTRAAIEDALPRLREMLAAQGLQLTQADVGDRAQRDAGGSSHGQGGQGHAGRDASGHPVRAASGAIDGARGEPSTVRRLGLIDIRV
jgi:flagellar hook-length control protein FliK